MKTGFVASQSILEWIILHPFEAILNTILIVIVIAFIIKFAINYPMMKMQIDITHLCIGGGCQ